MPDKTFVERVGRVLQHVSRKSGGTRGTHLPSGDPLGKGRARQKQHTQLNIERVSIQTGMEARQSLLAAGGRPTHRKTWPKYPTADPATPRHLATLASSSYEHRLIHPEELLCCEVRVARPLEQSFGREARVMGSRIRSRLKGVWTRFRLRRVDHLGWWMIGVLAGLEGEHLVVGCIPDDDQGQAEDSQG